MTPGNPLKKNGPAPLERRIAASRRLARHPRIAVTAFERDLPTRYTADTLAHVVTRRPDARFVWIMGADNLATFHEWQQWRRIAETLPIAVVDRPGSTLSFTSSRAAIALARHRIDESDAPLLAAMPPPAWVFLHGPRSSQSSTAIRARQSVHAT